MNDPKPRNPRVVVLTPARMRELGQKFREGLDLAKKTYDVFEELVNGLKEDGPTEKERQ